MAGSGDPKLLSQQRTGAVLFGAVLATIIVFLLPSHGFIGRPLIWLSTLVHELGHGIAAWLTGGRFTEFEMFEDGSGVARAYSSHDALVSAGGLLGPAIVAGLGFVLARRARVAQVSLLIAAAALVGLAIAVAGNWLAWVYMPALAAILVWVAARRDPEPAQIGVVFLATQLALSVFSRGDYLFENEAQTSRGVFPSDVAQIARELGGPYWLWGAVVGLFSVLVLIGGLWLFTREYPQLRGLGRLSKLRSAKR